MKKFKMRIVNIADLRPKYFSPHGGNNKVMMKFALSTLKDKGRKSNWNFFGYAEFPIGATAGWHKHERTDEWFYILDGKAEVIIDKERRPLKKGDVVLTKSGSYHDIVNVTKKLVFLAIEIETKK